MNEQQWNLALIDIHNETRRFVGAIVIDHSRHALRRRWTRLAAWHFSLGHLALIRNDSNWKTANSGIDADQ